MTDVNVVTIETYPWSALLGNYLCLPFWRDY